MKKFLLLLAAVLGTLGFAAAQTSTNPAPVSAVVAVTNAPPDTGWRFERRHLEQLSVVARTAEETLGADFDADRILTRWTEEVRGLTEAAQALELAPAPAAPAPKPVTAPVPALAPAGPANAAVEVDPLDQIQAHLRLASEKLERMKAAARPVVVAVPPTPVP